MTTIANPDRIKNELDSLHKEIMDLGILSSPGGCILQMATGSGKTTLAQRLINQTLTSNNRAIYITPLKAQAEELISRWRNQFAPKTVGVYTGDYGNSGTTYPIPFEQADLYIMTPERLDACTRFWRSHWNWIPKVTLLVIDELHLLGDPRRGARLEGAVSRFRRLNPFIRIIGLSATLGNRKELSQWLGTNEYFSAFRPVPLTWRIEKFKKASEKPQLLLEVVKSNLNTKGKSLVFVQSRRRAEQVSQYLQQHSIKASHHHAGLKPNQRKTIEHQFKNSDIDVLVATATLEMGVNLPVRQVVLYDLQQFDGHQYQHISVVSAWQRVGRAGRPGFDDRGEAVLIAPLWDSKVKHYEKGEFESIASSVSHPSFLPEQIIAEVASGLTKNEKQILRIFNQSHYLCDIPENTIKTNIKEMCDSGMLTEILNDKNPKAGLQLKATRIGYVAVRHMLTPATVLLFKRAIEQQELTFFDILLIASSSQDCEPIIPVDFDSITELSDNLSTQRSFLLQKPYEHLLKVLNIKGKRFLSAINMALICRRWTLTSDLEKVANESDCYPFEVSRLNESISRLLQSMLAILSNKENCLEGNTLADTDYIPMQEKIKALLHMVTAGIDESTVTLTLVDGIGPKLAKRLYEHGVEDIEDLALSSPNDIATLKGISVTRATKWIENAEKTLDYRNSKSYSEEGADIILRNSNWPINIDPYRFRRALDLKVKSKESGKFRITGGTDPHIVIFNNSKFKCDCIDWEKGNLCKHILAVRMARKEKELLSIFESVKKSNSDTVDLVHLWHQGDLLKAEGWR